MSRRPRLFAAATLALGGIALAASGAGAGREPAQDRPPTFRSGADAVTVDVSVRQRNGRPVTGLTAADFQVLDNGVFQQVDEVSYGRVPIDITVALDVSYSVTGALLDRLRQAVVQLMRDLRPEDRLKLVLFNMRVTRTLDYTGDVKAVEQAIRAASAGGGTALLDAITVTLVDAAPAGRRQLIVFFTDGHDSSSTTSVAQLPQIARRTRATLTFVMPTSGSTGTYSGAMTGTVVRYQTLGPRPPLHGLLTTLAAETGGSVLPVTQGEDLTGTFRRALNDFRSAYVLYYNPRGVDAPGYHTIEVKVNRSGAEVQARRGYFPQ
jgi:VWFA-related protein